MKGLNSRLLHKGTNKNLAKGGFKKMEEQREDFLNDWAISLSDL